MNRLQLLDLPPVWLGNLILAPKPDRGDPETLPLKPSFSTFSKLQQLLFSQPAIRPVLDIKPDDIEQLGGPLHFQALAMAEAAGTKLHLKLYDVGAQETFLGLLLTSAATIHHLQQAQKPPASLSLSCITAVTITEDEAPVRSLLPDVLVQHCPNLKELCLNILTVADEAGTSQLTCTSLQKLTLSDVNDVDTDWFKQQLLNLPSLTVLDLFEIGMQHDYEEGGVIWAVISRYSSQLKGLRSIRVVEFELLSALPWSPTTQLPLLQELVLNLTVKDDEEMQQLLQSAPNLKRLSLYSIRGLDISFAQVPCRWQELTLNTVYVAQLAMLPLSSCTRFKCTSSLYLSDVSHAKPPTPEQITAGVQAGLAVGLQFEGSINMKLYTDDLKRVPAAVPLLQQIKGWVTLWSYKPGSGDKAAWPDSRQLAAVLGQHLRCYGFCLQWNDWAGNPGAAAQLPELLPDVYAFEFSGYPAPPDAEVIRMVRDASRPFTLNGYGRLRAQLQEAMLEAGHYWVTIT